MVLSLEREPSTRLLRHVVGCYVRLSENSRYTNIFFNNVKKCCIWNTQTYYYQNRYFVSIIVFSFRAREALRQCLPDQLKDISTFSDCMNRDQTITAWLLLLKNNLESVIPIDASPGVQSLVKP